MLRSHWRAIVAVIGCLVFAGALWAVLRPIKPILPTYKQPQEIDPNYRAGGPNCYPAKLKAFAGGNAEEERARCRQAEEEHRLQGNNLIQQTRAADAAVGSTLLAYDQSLIGLVGSLVGFFTLVAAVLAAFYAKKAAEAAERSIHHSLDTAQAELRAYLMSERETVVRDAENGKAFRAHITLKNAGATPAQGATVMLELTFRYANGGVVEILDPTYPIGTLAPGATWDMKMDFKLERDEDRAFKAEKGRIALELKAFFVDNFGEHYIYSQDMSITKLSLEAGVIYTDDCRHTKQQPQREARPSKPSRQMILPPLIGRSGE